MINNFPKKIPIFPLSNFIIFPNTTVPLNIFEPRYLDMVNDAMKANKFIGMVQPMRSKKNIQKLHEIGCLGKITTFKETNDGRILIELKGVIRFRIIEELNLVKKYKECNVAYSEFSEDLNDQKQDINFSDLELIFKNLKSLFDKNGLIVNWESLKNQDLAETINALAMASPFSLEEKQILLETKNLDLRKNKITEILKTYSFDYYNNKTIQ